MASKIGAFFELFQQGKQVANPAAWKNGTIKANAVAGTLGAAAAVAAAFGYDLDLPPQVLEQVAAGAIALVGLVNAVMHVITSKKVGVQSKAEG